MIRFYEFQLLVINSFLYFILFRKMKSSRIMTRDRKRRGKQFTELDFRKSFTWTNKTDPHNITEILLKVLLNIIIPTSKYRYSIITNELDSLV